MSEKIKTNLIKPHNKVSRPVEDKDVDRVYNEAKEMYKIFDEKIGIYRGYYAIAHPQIEGENPLRFFVVNPKADIMSDLPEAVIINPEIYQHDDSFPSHSGEKKEIEEGCLTFPNIPPTKVRRWYKCQVRFKVLLPHKQISGWKYLNTKGTLAQVFQHEIDHLDAKYIY